MLDYDFANKDSKNALPISFGYTFTNTEFKNSFGSSNDLREVVTGGDELHYIPRHQWGVGFSLEHTSFKINLNARFNGEFRNLAGSGIMLDIEKVAVNFIIDLSVKYVITKQLNATVDVINLLDTTYSLKSACWIETWSSFWYVCRC